MGSKGKSRKRPLDDEPCSSKSQNLSPETSLETMSLTSVVTHPSARDEGQENQGNLRKKIKTTNDSEDEDLTIVSSAEDESQVPNPLYISHIIETVLSHMKFDELKMFRQISTDWNMEALKYLYPKNVVTLCTYDEFKLFFRNYRYTFVNAGEGQGDQDEVVPAEPVAGPSTRVEVNKNVKTIPFCNSLFLRSTKISLEMNYVQKMLNECGQYITSLHLQKIKWTEALLARLLFHQLPNLEDLVFELVDYEVRSTVDTVEENRRLVTTTDVVMSKLKTLSIRIDDPFDGILLMKDLILAAPNVEHISTRVKNRTPDEDWSRLQNEGRIFLRDHNMILALPFPFNGVSLAANEPFHMFASIQLSGYDFFDIILAGVIFYDIRPLPPEPQRPECGHAPGVQRRNIIDFVQRMNAAASGLHQNALRKVSKFDLRIKYNNNIVQRLIHKAFPLKTLNMTCVTVDLSTKLMNELLESLKDTLENLTVKWESSLSMKTNVDFQYAVHLYKLKTLSLENYKGTLHFMTNLDQLRSLTVISANFNKLIVSSNFSPNFCRPNLKFVHLYHNLSCDTRIRHRPVKVSTVREMSRVFPNLETLRMEDIGDAALKEVFRGFPQMKHLSITESTFGDAAVCGVGRDTLERLQLLLVKTKGPQIKNLFQPMKRLGPWIGSLKNLLTLELSSSKLTDLSVVHGLCRCTGLRRLTLMAYGVTNISLRFALETLDLHYFETRHCTQLTVEDMNIAQEMAKRKPHPCELIINQNHRPDSLYYFLRRYGDAKVKMERLSMEELEKYTD